MRRKFACNPNDNYKLIKIDEPIFHGYVCYLKLQDIKEPIIVYNGKESICARDNDYVWIEAYPNNGKYAITIIYDDKGNLVEWYFDISKGIGIENGIPYEDDLYLDMVITPNEEELVLDEDELLAAKDNGDIKEEDVIMAYNTLKELENKYVKNIDELKKLTACLLNVFKNTDTNH